jgi:hypothetical protein
LPGLDVLLPHLPSLQYIQAVTQSPEDLRALQRMPNLSALDLALMYHDDPVYTLDGEVGFSKLRSLRVEGVECPPISVFIDFVSRLTGLTSFTWAYATFDLNNPIFTTLAHLSNLKSLCLKHKQESVLDLVDLCSLIALTGLTRLEFGMRPLYEEPDPGVLPALSALTCLRELKVWAEYLPVAELALLRVESLHRLELGPLWDTPDAQGLAVLRRATNLTRLCFHAHAHEVDEGLGRVVQGLRRLRSLDIKYSRSGDVEGHGTSACLIRQEDLAPLTALTYLKLSGVLSEHADVASLAASLCHPPWFTEAPGAWEMPGGGVGEGGGGSCAPIGAGSLHTSQGLVSPHGPHMLGDFCTKDVEGYRRADPWAISFGLDDKEEGYFVDTVTYW